MSRWAEFYRGRMNDDYRAHVARKYAPLIEMIVKLGRDARCVAEMGCGAANISRHVARGMQLDTARRSHGAHHVLTDACGAMLNLARDNIDYSPECSGNTFEFVTHDLLSNDYTHVARARPKVIHGHGVLEHFADEEIRHIVDRQLMCAKFVLHYVPTSKYKEPSFGDERLMTPMDWDRIARPHFKQLFNDGHDLLLGWRNE